MLTSFSLSNFKAFGPEQRIPLRPITLVFGANSSGKSSIIHSLLLAHHAQDTGDWDITHPKLGGDAVDIGGFASYLHQRDQNLVGAVSMSFEKTLGTDFEPSCQLLAYAKEVRMTVNINKAKTPSAKLRECQLDVDGVRLFLLTPKQDGQSGLRMSLNIWETSHPLSERLITWAIQRAAVQGGPGQYRDAVIREIVAVQQTATLDSFGFLPSDVRFPSPAPELLHPTTDQRLGIEARKLFTESVRSLVADLHRLFSDDLKRLEYLGPLRSYPSRHLLDDESTDPNWRSGGGFAWKLVRDDEVVRTKVNQWLRENRTAPYKLDVRRLADEATIRQSLEKRIADHDAVMIRAIAEKEEKEDSIAEQTGLTTLDGYKYVEAHPDLKADLIEQAVQAFKNNNMFGDLEPDDMPLNFESAAEDYVANASLNQSGDFVWDGIREHFLENNEAFGTLATSLSDPKKTAEWMTEAIFKEAEDSCRTELILIDQRSNTAVTHRDVGIGISQVLPVLVHAYASKNKLIAIEQPEIHLHPALQAELGDLFIESALGENGNNFILETHSEHLILRLLRRVRETTAGELAKDDVRRLSPSDLCVLYAQPTEQGSTVIELPVTEDGDFGVPWPGGFFAERTRELF